jgi:hypothetical protein
MRPAAAGELFEVETEETVGFWNRSAEVSGAVGGGASSSPPSGGKPDGSSTVQSPKKQGK